MSIQRLIAGTCQAGYGSSRSISENGDVVEFLGDRSVKGVHSISMADKRMDVIGADTGRSEVGPHSCDSKKVLNQIGPRLSNILILRDLVDNSPLQLTGVSFWLHVLIEGQQPGIHGGVLRECHRLVGKRHGTWLATDSAFQFLLCEPKQPCKGARYRTSFIDIDDSLSILSKSPFPRDNNAERAESLPMCSGFGNRQLGEGNHAEFLRLSFGEEFFTE